MLSHHFRLGHTFKQLEGGSLWLQGAKEFSQSQKQQPTEKPCLFGKHGWQRHQEGKRSDKGQALPLASRLADGKLKRWEQRCALERWPLQISFASAYTRDSLTRNPPLSKPGQHSGLEDISPRMKIHFQMRAFGLENLTKEEM